MEAIKLEKKVFEEESIKMHTLYDDIKAKFEKREGIIEDKKAKLAAAEERAKNYHTELESIRKSHETTTKKLEVIKASEASVKAKNVTFETENQ